MKKFLKSWRRLSNYQDRRIEKLSKESGIPKPVIYEHWFYFGRFI